MASVRLTVIVLKNNQELLICMAIEVLFEGLRDCKTCKLDSEKLSAIAEKVVNAGPIASIEFILSLTTLLNCFGEYMIKYGHHSNLPLITEVCSSLMRARPKEDVDVLDYTRDYFHRHKGGDWYSNTGDV